MSIYIYNYNIDNNNIEVTLSNILVLYGGKYTTIFCENIKELNILNSTIVN